MAEVQWYYARNDQQFGPVSGQELKELADAGRLSPDDLLWREGMDQWATAINLRGLFTNEASAAIPPTAEPNIASTIVVTPAAPTAGRSRPVALSGNLRRTLRTTQMILWSTCVLVVLVGMVRFTLSFSRAATPQEEAAAAAVFATFFVGAYVLARSGEKLSRILLSRRR